MNATYYRFAAAGGGAVQATALSGPLRVIEHPAARTHGLGDDTGPRMVIGCTNFCAGRDWRDNRAQAVADIKTAAAAGYQYKRVMRVIGFDGDGTVDGGWFAGRGVSPLWRGWIPEYCEVLLEHGLGMQVTCGHNGWTYAQRLDWEEAWMADVAGRGLGAAIKFVEGDNEFWQNAPGKTSDEQIQFYRQLRDLVHQYFPYALFACGAPEDESPANIVNACGVMLTDAEKAYLREPGSDAGRFFGRMFTDILEIHTARDEDRMIKRQLGVWYWEGHPGYFPLPVLHGEPTPLAGGPGDFMGTQFPGKQMAQASLAMLNGHAYTYFDGWDVSSPEPLDVDAPTFHTIPRWLREVFPENVAESTILPDPPGRRLSVLWWKLPDGRVATVLEETWNGLASQPDLRSWKAYGPDNKVLSGQGRVELPAGYGGALVVGEPA